MRRFQRRRDAGGAGAHRARRPGLLRRGDLKEMAATSLRCRRWIPAPNSAATSSGQADDRRGQRGRVRGGFLLAQTCDLCVAADQPASPSPRQGGRGAPWAAPAALAGPTPRGHADPITGEPSTPPGLRDRSGQPGGAPDVELGPGAGTGREASPRTPRCRSRRPSAPSTSWPRGRKAERGGRRALGAGVPQRGRPGGAPRLRREAPPVWTGPMTRRRPAVHRRRGHETTVADRRPLGALRRTSWRLQRHPRPGWAVLDQVSHLAYFDEGPHGIRRPRAVPPSGRRWPTGGDDFPDRWPPATATRPAPSCWPGSEAPGPDDERFGRPIPRPAALVRAGMSAASSLTARIMETWAHSQDIADALGVTRGRPTAAPRRAHRRAHACYSYAVHQTSAPGRAGPRRAHRPGRRPLDLGTGGRRRPGNRPGPGLLPAGDPAQAPRRSGPGRRRARRRPSG